MIMKCIAALRVTHELLVPWHQGNSRCLRLTRIRRISRFLVDGRSDVAASGSLIQLDDLDAAHGFTVVSQL